VLQCVALRSRDDAHVLQCVALCCNVLQYVALRSRDDAKLLYGIATDLTNENSDSCGMI